MSLSEPLKFVKAPWNNGIYTNIFTPRPYQIEILERALRRNTIVCLNTEAGKRFISTMVLRESMVVNNHCSQTNGTTALLLLNNDFQVMNEFDVLRHHLDINLTTCIKGTDPKTEDECKNIFLQYQIIITTPELLLSCLHLNGSLGHYINLIIFDDCHLICNEDHPYYEIMKILDDQNLFPHILGLTSSVISDDVSAEMLQQFIKKMETLLHATAETATDLIALDRNSLSQPNENIILSTDHHTDQEEVAKRLNGDLHLILKKALNWIQNCQVTSSCTISTTYWQISKMEEEKDVAQYSTNSASRLKNTERDEHSTNTVDPLKAPLRLIKEVILVLDVLGPWCVHHLLVLILKQLQKAILSLERQARADGQDMDDEVLTGSLVWQLTMLRHMHTTLRMAYMLCYKFIGGHKTINFKLISPKVHRLLEVLKEYKPPDSDNSKKEAQKYNNRSELDYVSWWQDSDAEEDDDITREEGEKKESFTSPFTNTLCGIVFVQEKCVAMMLQRLLHEVCKEDKGLKHVCSSHLIYSSPDTESECCYLDTSTMGKAKQEEVLRKFRSHETNLLICTGNLEDCAFMPKCNLVVRFDVPRSYRHYAQSKSRARAHTSAYIMLVREAEKQEFIEKLQEYKKVEQVLQGPQWMLEEAVLMQETIDDLADSNSDILPPYSTGGNNFATMRNAIKIVNRYCCRLPSDPFTHLSPLCEVKVVKDSVSQPLYQCTLQMPINSHVREKIQGHPMTSAILAQRAVALATCERLHQAGELDNSLMPIGKETVKYAEELDPWNPEKTSVSGRPGSTKRRQTYNKETPLTLTNCIPGIDGNVFIYEIRMRIRIPLSEELNVRRRKLYFPEDTNRCFGILTTKPIPNIPGFPIFTRSGEESARLCLCRSYVSLSPQHISLVRSFHRYVFSDILRLDRVPLSFQPTCASSQILVVVLNKGYSHHFHPNTSRLDIDWSFMVRTDSSRLEERKKRRDPWFSHQISELRKKFVFRRETYEDGVVIAKYRSCDQPNRFYVAEIKQGLTPASSFPSNEYQSFQHYYRHKYGLHIRCLEQPLLDVDHTSSRLNLLTPRHLNHKGKFLPLSSLEKKRAKYESLHNRQILVPELCEVHPIPASLWRKAVCLPSVLYRIGQLLIAEELRLEIAYHSGIASVLTPVGLQWPDLDFGWESSSISMGNHLCNSRSTDCSKLSPNQDALCVEAHESQDNVVFPCATKDSNMPYSDADLPTNNITKLPLLNIPAENLDATCHICRKASLHSCNCQKFQKAEAYSRVTCRKSHESSATTNTVNNVEQDKERSTSLPSSFCETNCISDHQDSKVSLTRQNCDNFEDFCEHSCGLNENSYASQYPEKVSENTNNSGTYYILRKDDFSKERQHVQDVSTDSDSQSYCSDDFFANFELEMDINNDMETLKNPPKMGQKQNQTSVNFQEFFHYIPQSLWKSLVLEANKVSTGPGPGIILQALTLSNASDGFNLERLEMLGDSFLKHAVTVYLYCTYPDAHEGKLSYMRSKKVSNYNLYRIGRRFGLAGKMTTLNFDPTVNWMPTGFVVGSEEHRSEEEEDLLSEDDVEIGIWTGLPDETQDKKSLAKTSSVTESVHHSPRSIPTIESNVIQREVNQDADEELYEEEEIQMIDGMLGGCIQNIGALGIGSTGTNGKVGIDLARAVSGHGSMHFTDKQALRKSNLVPNTSDEFVIDTWTPVDLSGKPLHNSDPLMLDLHTQHSLADKSVADCVEALLGAYLTSCGQRAAQLLLCHLGLQVLPKLSGIDSLKTCDLFGYLDSPRNQLIYDDDTHKTKLCQLLKSLGGFERRISYTFNNKAYLLQAFTHASYHYNTVTDCYQRLEFLGDAVLDFLITRHLFHDERRHSPGALTDLRSALVNNTIFASLAVRYGFHKYFKSISPELQRIIEEFVSYQQRQEEAQGMDAQLMRYYGESSLLQEDLAKSDEDLVTSTNFFDCDEEEDGETEDVEVPKALGDIFESVAGAIYMDSGMRLSAVWQVYSPMMLPLIEKFSSCVPRSPVRELLEMEPETAKFSCAEKRYDGKVRVTVEIIGKGRFKGVGRSYRIAKSAAARRALRFLKYKYY